MVERVHEHIVGELRQNSRTDTVFVLTAILLNLVMLAANATIAASSKQSAIATVVMAVLMVLVVVINIVAVVGLLKGKSMRHKLLDGVVLMYRDHNVDKYYDASLLKGYDTRYTLLILAIGSIGVISIVVPIITRIF